MISGPGPPIDPGAGVNFPAYLALLEAMNPWGCVYFIDPSQSCLSRRRELLSGSEDPSVHRGNGLGRVVLREM